MLKTMLATSAVAFAIVAVAMPTKTAKPVVSTIDAKPAMSVKQPAQTNACDPCCDLPKCPVAVKPADCGPCPLTSCGK